MRTDKMLWRNRKLKKELARQLQSENPGLEVTFGLPVTWANFSGTQQRKKDGGRIGKKSLTYSYMGIY
ncbi:MAG TPA: hypothetical protein VK818_09950 [Methylomirabilota bacterium]|jgi:hypothetical protein|nr:hypothetical protein [Methylomirabilota bacterium]